MRDLPTTIEFYLVEAFGHFARQRPLPEIDVRYYPYAGLNSTIRVRNNKVYARISDVLRDAPTDVLRALAHILVAKLLRRKIPPDADRIYRVHSTRPEVLRANDLARRQRGRKMLTPMRGRIYDLQKLFRRLNRLYFADLLPQPVLSWSQRRTRRILGHHDATHDTIVISKTLDAPDVPSWVVEFVLYHEMLHIKHPAKMLNGRRYYHTKAFRADEKNFAFYQQAQDWLEQRSQTPDWVRARAA